MLINSNKQLIEKFEKNVKDNETNVSKGGVSAWPNLESEDFLMHDSL